MFFTNSLKKRRISQRHPSRKFNFIYHNSVLIIKSLKRIAFFMREMMKVHHYEMALEFTQILSKANFFKCKNKIPEYRILKTEIF